MRKITKSCSFLQSRANFSLCLNKFMIFLRITLDDLKGKRQTLKAQQKILGQNHSAKTYLSCQIYMLKKHIQRLDNFNAEIQFKLNEFLRNAAMKYTAINGNKPTSLAKTETHDDGTSDKNIQNSLKINCRNLENNMFNYSTSIISTPRVGCDDDDTLSTGFMLDDCLNYDKGLTTSSVSPLSLKKNVFRRSCEDTENVMKINMFSNDKTNYSSAAELDACDGTTTRSNCSLMNTIPWDNIRTNSAAADDTSLLKLLLENSMDQELLKLLANVKNRKTLCKKILDITDKYCVVSNELDLSLHLQEDEQEAFNINLSKSPITSQWATRSSTDIPKHDENGPRNNNTTNSSNLQLPVSINNRGWIKMTLQSFGDHASFLIKTYTHS